MLNRKYNITIFVLLLMFSFLISAKLINIPITLQQPNNEEFDCLTSGDEYYHWLHDEEGFSIVQNKDDGYYYYADKIMNEIVPSEYRVNTVDPYTINLNKGIKISSQEYYQRKNIFWEDVEMRDAPSIGTLNNLNVFIRFADENEFSDTRSYYNIPFNLEEGPSMYHYFKEVSYELLTVNTVHYPICNPDESLSYQDQFTRDYYRPYNEVTNPIGYQNDNQARDREHVLLKNAIEFIADEVPNDLDIDANDDGYVDNVTFLVKGSPGAWADLLWPHRWALYNEEAYINGARVWDYNLNLEQGGYFTVGTLCHEFFHSLGSPDLYHYWDDVAPVAVGGWDVMDASSDIPQSMSAYMKYRYTDWITELPVISYGGTYELNPLSMDSNNIYRINSPLSNIEYFVLEYRVKEGLYEINTPGGVSGDNGLVIYRINDTLNGNGNGPPDEIYVYRINGTPNSNGTFSGAIFNAESGRDKFNDNTNPSCFLYDGSPGGINISNIGSPEDVIRFDVGNMTLLPENLGISDDNDVSDGDGIINPGEQITFEIQISNLSNLDAQNVTATIGDDNIEYGDINNSESTINYYTKNILGDSELGSYLLYVTVNATYEEDGQSIEYNDSFTLEYEVSINQAGFPYYTLNEIHTSPIILDLDLNEENEIIFGDHFGMIRAIDSNGVEVLTDILPIDTGDQIWGSPASADIDLDGYEDVIVVSKSQHVYAFDINGLKWTFDTNSQLVATPSIGNLNTTDELEIIIGGYSNNTNNFFILNHLGEQINSLEIMGKNKAGFAVADINGNNLDDIVFGTDDNKIYLINDDGSIRQGFPFIAPDKFRVSPLILETINNTLILAACENNKVYAINISGELEFEFELNSSISTSMSILEYTSINPTSENVNTLIFIGCDNGDVISFNEEGIPIILHNISSKVVGSIIFSDVNNDSYPEIIAVNNLGDLYLINLDGSLFIQPVPYNFPFSSSPLIFDLDQDFDLEIIAGATNAIIGIDLKESALSQDYWNMYAGNNLRQNYYLSQYECLIGDVDFDGIVNIFDVIILVECIFSSSCGICAEITGDGVVDVLDIISLVNIILQD